MTGFRDHGEEIAAAFAARYRERAALDALIAAVEGGTAATTHFGAAWPHAMSFEHSRALKAYHGSLDAAKALHDALLPGAWFRLAGPWRDQWCAIVYTLPSFDVSFRGEHPTNPARALLLATLRAYRAQIGGAE